MLARFFYLVVSTSLCCLIVQEGAAKSLRDIHLGNTHFGYRYHGKVDAQVAGTEYDAGYHGVFLGYSRRFQNNSKNSGRLTWDSSFNLSVLSVDSALLDGARFGLRTGIGYEYQIVQQMLLKLELGVDLHRVSTDSTSPTLPAEEESWEFGGHVEASLIYYVHPGISVFGSIGMESLGEQSFQNVEIDFGSSITFSTGIFFPW